MLLRTFMILSLAATTACVPALKRPQFKASSADASAANSDDADSESEGSDLGEEDSSSELETEDSSSDDSSSETTTSQDSSTSTHSSTSTDSTTSGGTSSETSSSSSSSGKDLGGKSVALVVPSSQKVVYRPLGLTSGGYQAIKEAVWPDKCVKGDVVPTTGALFPFNESQHLIVRGPLVLSDLVVFRRKGDVWSRLSDLSSLKWQESNFGAVKEVGSYPMKEKILENGREIYTALPETGEKIVVARLKMPRATSPVYATGAQDDVPALWMLNSRIFQAPSSQYFCNCRGVGNPGGCGELDIAEIIPENKTEVTTTLYTYEGARGGILSKPRPISEYQIYATILRSDGSAGEVAVLEASSFDFNLSEFPNSFVSEKWLPVAKALNKGSEAMIPPSK